MTDSDTELFDIVCDVLRTDLKLGAVEQMQSQVDRRASRGKDTGPLLHKRIAPRDAPVRYSHNFAHLLRQGGRDAAPLRLE